MNSECPSCGAPLFPDERIPSRIGSLCTGCAVLYSKFESRLFQGEMWISLPLFVLPNALFWMSILSRDVVLSVDLRMGVLAFALVLALVSAVLSATGVIPLFGKRSFLWGFRESQTDAQGRPHPLLWTARLPSEGGFAFSSILLRIFALVLLIPVAGASLSLLTLIRRIRSVARGRNHRETLSSGEKCYPESFVRDFRHPLVGTFLDPDRNPTLSLKVGDRKGEWINEGHVVYQEILYGVIRKPGSEEMIFLSLDSVKGGATPADPETGEAIQRMIKVR